MSASYRESRAPNRGFLPVVLTEASSLWFPAARTLTADALMTALATHAPEVLDTEDRRVFARRKEVVALTFFLEPESPLEGREHLFVDAARALAKALRTRAWALCVTGGAADLLAVTAFDAKGTQRWVLSAFEDVDQGAPDWKRAVATVKRTFGADAVPADELARRLPYWRLWADVSKKAAAVLDFPSKPALELLAGWKTEPLVLTRELGELLAAARKARRKKENEQYALSPVVLAQAQRRIDQVAAEQPVEAPSLDLDDLRARLARLPPLPTADTQRPRDAVRRHPEVVLLIAAGKARGAVSALERERLAALLARDRALALTRQHALDALSWVLRDAGISLERE